MPCYPSASACMHDGKTRGRLNVPTVNDAALFFAHARVRFAQFLFFFSVRTDFTLPRNRAWRPRPRLGPGPGRGRGRTDDAAASTDRRLRDRPRPSDRRRARRPSVRLCASVRPFLRSVPPPSPRSTFNHAPDILHVRPRGSCGARRLRPRPPKHGNSSSFRLLLL